MTREEAINRLEESRRQNKIMQESPTTFFKSSDICEGVKNAKLRIEALDMAISALRAQQTPMKLDRSQWEGCEYCNETLNRYPWVSAAGIGEHGIIYQTPEYCPVCGRPLTEEAWAELERRIGGINND